ncbi:OmpA family protein [Chondromyces apiculatus]|uniref:OmpA protein n=1 Tax=Chondromyces apiculatus DSM 436 TaxID=1192034 RepID=A0A017TFF4_9BACT|nr:OmpA family protein [Chondromyces apiculatus]EYF07351.1 OmpA protein [Chondromyces apiculatus DSM 436]
MSRRNKGVHVAKLSLVILAAAAGCSQVPKMRGEIEGLAKIAEQAQRNGALRCAPRELAMAKSHLSFAEIELDQGFFARANDHLSIAKSNAHAAYDLSPPTKCAERGFIEEEAPPPPKPGDCDGDGLLDPEETEQCRCEPENYNGFEDHDGCPDDPDTDGDGIPDSKDSCVLNPEDKDGYLDEDGCPDIDNDLDGILDTNDKDATGRICINDPEDPDGYEDTDGCPEPDNDQDKVVDIEDQCPNEPGVQGGDKPGCPKKPSLVIVTDKEIKITQQIHFEFDKDKIRSESFLILDAVVEVLQQNPKIKLEIQGHTDNKGAPAYNKSLSDRRAASVKKYLVAKGIDATRLTSKGYGMEKPIVPNTTDQNRALNRRVQFVRTEGSP